MFFIPALCIGQDTVWSHVAYVLNEVESQNDEFPMSADILPPPVHSAEAHGASSLRQLHGLRYHRRHCL